MLDTQLRELEFHGKPIRVGMIGAGATARAIALQLCTPVPGIRLVGIANRTLANAERVYREAGVSEWRQVYTTDDVEVAIANNVPVLTDDPLLLTACDPVDIIVEVTGSVGPAAKVVLDAIDHHKDVVLVNAELDSLLGPILKVKADQAGVTITHTDGDEPGVAMTLLRYLRSLGLRTVAMGNIKGMVDYYRNPATQEGFAKANDQDVRKVTSFADATKLSMETTVQANATGFHVGKRGMYGPKCDYVRDLASLLPQAANHAADQLLDTGLVDYSVGAAPHTGGWVMIHETNPLKMAQLAYYKIGAGPFYVFYTPFHLPHIQLAATIGNAVINRDATVAPLAGPVCEVLTIAKRDLKAGDRLDGIGGFDAYGLIENTADARAIAALPIGLSEGCVLKRDIAKDAAVSFDDVILPSPRLEDALWFEQLAHFNPRQAAGRLLEAVR